MHAVPVGARGTDIDHVLVGPTGVITINTKHHRGKKARVKSASSSSAKTPRSTGRSPSTGTTRAVRLLTAAPQKPVPVRSAVVIVGARSIQGSRSAGVEIMPKLHLLVWLLFQRRALSRTEVDRVYEIARRSTTWQRG
jgi:hypothetical protein